METEKTAEQLAETLRLQVQHELNEGNLEGMIDALNELKAIGQPLRDPDLAQHARQMTKLAERATYQAFCEANFYPLCAYLHKRYVELQRLW